LGGLVAQPTVSAWPDSRPVFERVLRVLARHLGSLGCDVRIMRRPGRAIPSLLAQLPGPPGARTVLLYGHLDVQPPGPAGQWTSPPFRPTRRGRRLIGRGSSDNKGQLVAYLDAVEAWAGAGGPPLNLKLWLDSEEEIGDPHVVEVIDAHRELLAADVVLSTDTAMARAGRPTITTGLRGLVLAELEVAGPRRELHAGRFGGAAASPAEGLAAALAGLHRADGSVALDGFYDRVVPVLARERRRLREQGPCDAELLARIAGPVHPGPEGTTLFERATIRPALVVTGLDAGGVGSSGGTSVPTRALARMSLRLVPDQRPDEVAAQLRARLARVVPGRFPHRLRVLAEAPPYAVAADDADVVGAARALERVWGRAPTFLRSGGSIPALAWLHERIGAPVVLVGLGLADDHAHGGDESVDLRQLDRSVETVIRVVEAWAS
jgi:acetylornithine deacetylase/succinyl-diaminopimelate desuccinylase-like protein